MAIKISNYIMEQEISDASVDDIELARCYAEMQVVSALIGTLAKQELIAEHTSTDVSEFDIFQEDGETDGESYLPAEVADKSDKSDEGKSKKKGNIFKRAWNGFCQLMTRIGEGIIKFFSRFKFKSLMERVQESDKTKYLMSANIYKAIYKFEELLALYSQFGDLLNDVGDRGAITTDKSKYDEILEKLNDIEREVRSRSNRSTTGMINDEEAEYSKQRIIEMLEVLQHCQENKIPNVKKTLKKFDALAAKSLDEDVYGVIIECGKKFHNLYVTLNRDCNEVVMKCIKPQTSKNYKEYYTPTSSDSDYVQEFTLGDLLMGAGISAVVGSISSAICRTIERHKYIVANDKLVQAIKSVMEILEGGDEKLKRNLRDFNKGLKKIKEYLPFAKNSYVQLTVRENKQFNEITKDLEEYIDAVLVFTDQAFGQGKKHIKKDTHRLGDRIKEMAEECQNAVEFLVQHSPDKKNSDEE